MNGFVVKTGAVALALALAGCGGGNGGDSAPSAVTPVAQRVVQGTAAKGLIKGAKVSIYTIDAEGLRSAAAIASATTGTDGTYKLEVPASVLNFLIEVSAAPGAVMADEVTGTDLPLPESMKLRNVVTLADNATGPYVGTVSPLTEMVARTAETPDGKLPRQAVGQAKASVRSLLGFDPETVKPVNSNSAAVETATEDEKNQSLALAAISKMGNAASADCGQSTPGERISCVVTKLAASVTTSDGQPALEQNRLAQFRDAIQSVAADPTVNRTGKTKVVGIPALNPTPAPGQPPAANLTPLEATKALFGSLRNNINVLNEGGAFRTTADAIAADLDGAIAPLGNDASGFASLAVNALDRLDRYRANPSIGTKFNVWNQELAQGYTTPQYVSFGRGDGVCQITQSPLAMYCTVYLVDLGGFQSSNTGYFLPYAERVLKIEPKAGSTTEFAYSVSLQRREYQYVYATRVANTTVAQPLGGLYSGSMVFARSGETTTQLAVNGRMPGRLENGVFQSDYESWSLNVARTEEAGIALYKFGAALTAVTGNTSAGTVEIDDTSFLRVAMEQGGTRVVANAANELQVKMRGTVGATTVDGTLRISGHKQDKSKTKNMPTRLSFDGSLKHKDATVFSGNVAITRSGYENFDATLDESDTNFVADTVELGGALSVPNRPTLSLTVGATRTGADSAGISAQYRDGTSVINASSTAKRGERHPLVKVSSAEGVAFEFTDTTRPVQVTKDGAVTALIDLARGIVSYSDGNTESLK